MTSPLSCLGKIEEQPTVERDTSQADGLMERNSAHIPIRSAVGTRAVQGARGGEDAIPVEAQNLMVEYLDVPPCPSDLAAFLEETSLERLVYWKLAGLFEKVDELEDILELVLMHVERPLFALALRKTRGNQSKAAKVLGCNRNTLHRKLRALSIQPMELRKAIKESEQRKLAKKRAPGK